MEHQQADRQTDTRNNTTRPTLTDIPFRLGASPRVAPHLLLLVLLVLLLMLLRPEVMNRRTKPHTHTLTGNEHRVAPLFVLGHSFR